MGRVKELLFDEQEKNNLRASSYLRLEDLRLLQHNLKTIDKELYHEVTDWINVENRGEYLSNIFTGNQIVKLLRLQKDWKLL